MANMISIIPSVPLWQRALNFCCPCLTTPDRPSKGDLTEAAAVAMDGKELANGDDPSSPHPPTPPEDSAKGGPSKGDGSSVPRVCDNIMKAAEVGMNGKELADAELDGLINYIGRLLEIVRGKKSQLRKSAEEKLQQKKSAEEKSQQKKSAEEKSAASKFWSMITSTDLLNLKELLTGVTELASAMKELFSANNVAVHVLKGIGHASLATAGLLVFATVLERFENLSDIQEECLYLFEQIHSLAKHVRDLQRFPQLKEELKEPLEKATELILEASILSCAQIDSKIFTRFCKTSDNNGNLVRIREELKAVYRDLDNRKFLCEFSLIRDIANSANSQKTRKAVPIEYPQGTVGMHEPLRKVIELLEWQSEKKALAVVVHGFGGLGKTTLANAVYATLFDTKPGCRYCMVKLFENIDKPPNVIDLQTQMIKDLRSGTPEEDKPMPEIKTFEDGQREIGHLLDKQVAFIYIDNVLSENALRQLLPEKWENVTNLRLLLTARETTATNSLIKVRKYLYPIEHLPETEAKKLIKEILDVNEKELKPSEMDQIVSICGGVPKLLTVVAGFIGCEGNAQEAFDTVKEEWENNWKGKIGDDIERYVFACNKLEKNLREAFLDICSFFQGWDWEELSNIVGKPALNDLRSRALVTQDVKSMTATVHDVILTVGLGEIKGERRIFYSASEIQEFLHGANKKTLRNIKGIWCSDNTDHTLKISAEKLDWMAASLRVLKLGPLTVVEGKCQKSFKELVFFSAGISHLPFVVSMSEKLTHLCYSPEDLTNLSQMPSALRHIDFQLKSPSFKISSTCIKQLRKLRVLRLKNAEFKKLPPNLGDLEYLQELTLLNCNILEGLPESFSTLGSLRVLRMDSCSCLTQLPEGFGKLTKLQELHFSQCKSLEVLPTSFGKLTSLQELHLAGCKSLEALPVSLEELSSLRLLDLSECPIENLPDDLGKLTSLVNLRLDGCFRLESIPESIGRLTSLDSINLSDTWLEELPHGFCGLSITRLTMDRCRILERLPARFGELTSLRRLSLDNCHSLKKLPESFSQLKYLEYLNLSNCFDLKELCEDFKDLSRLRVLLLYGCHKIKKLPQDFNGLPSLDTLVLADCNKLEGKSMEGIVKLKKLQTLLISGSHLLLEEWGEIKKQSDQPWSFAVETEEDSLQGKGHFNLTNGGGKPFNISDLPLPLNTDLLVLFDCRRESRHCSTLKLIEENIEENMDDHLEMIYFGNHFTKLPPKVAGGICGHAPAELFGQLFPLFASLVKEKFELSVISAKIVPGEKGENTLACDLILEKVFVEEFVVEKCGRYLKLKQLVKTAGDSNIELLRELFANGEFLKNGESTKVGVEELKGKRILLDMRPANLCYDIPLQSLVDLYNVVEKERSDFEIITIPMMQENTRSDVSNSFSTKVPWLVLKNPRVLTNATKYFLVEGSKPWEVWQPLTLQALYPSKMRVVESNGTMAAYNPPDILCMVNTWGREAFPFTGEKRRELIDKEVKQMKEMSNLMFLFQHLPGISEQVEKAMRQQKMFWLCIGDCTTFMKSMSGEWNDNFYTIYIPTLGCREEMETVYFTHGRSEVYNPFTISEVEREGMFSLSLSKHEAIRFWARIFSLYSFGNKMLDPSLCKHDAFMIIMDEDGNLITRQGKKGKNIIWVLLWGRNDKAKDLVQQLINGDKESRKETLMELEPWMISG